jgi:HPt (histidine-containing phosphotransfer) domain-containing protein
VVVGVETQPELARLDLERLNEIVGTGSASFARARARRFRDDEACRIGDLKEAVQSRDTTGSEAIAHTIRGASINFGASRLAELAARVEHTSSFERQDVLLGWVELLSSELRLLHELMLERGLTSLLPHRNLPDTGED